MAVPSPLLMQKSFQLTSSATLESTLTAAWPGQPSWANWFEVVFTNCVGSKSSVNSFRPQLPLSWTPASSSPGLITATAYWGVCRFANWNGFKVLNAAACLIYGWTPSDHVTGLLRDNLHWLRIPQRITCKLCLITYKAIHNCMPD